MATKGMEKILRKMANDELALGTHVKWNDPTVSEALMMAGYDYLWIDNEHGTMALADIQNHIRMAQANDAAAFVRIAWNDMVLAKPVLEMGPDGIIFPFIRTKEEAEAAVAACRYPPIGVRGWAPGRAMRHGHMTQEEYVKEANKVWVIAQIEHIDAVKNIDSILEVEGVDAYIVGMSDLSSSMGILNQLDNPELIEILDGLAEKFKAAGKPFGTATGFRPPVLKQWVERGGRLISIGGDEEFLCRQSTLVHDEMWTIFNENK